MKNEIITQEQCLQYLEKMRWGKTVKCPYCHSERTHPSRNETGRHFCYNCVKSFSVLVGTIFEDTRLELPIWFGIIKTMVSNKSGLSAIEISERFNITLKTAWLTAMKIRCAMIDSDTQLHGILQMDESYLSSKPKQSKKLDKYAVGKSTNKATAGSKKIKPKNIEQLTPMNLLGLLKHYIKTDKQSKGESSFRSFAEMDNAIESINMKHNERREADVNMMESYWDYIKDGIRDNYKSLSKKYLPFYIVEYEYKFKRKNKRSGLFSEFIKNAVATLPVVPVHKTKTSKKKIAYAER